MDTKASYVDALATGRTKYVAWEYAERDFSFRAPGIALMTGRAHIKVAKTEGTTEMLLSFLGVWRQEKGVWRFWRGNRQNFRGLLRRGNSRWRSGGVADRDQP